ncbi:tetratricopeptide repeat protein [Maribacter litoralis]|uniref:tetratricopeptide repeat protein n=1 Tax=Maribacter litoralis TaxID=2059726 RepID=UPI003D2DAB36
MTDKEQLLLKYFDGSLTADEKVNFNQFLESDAEFRTQFEFEKDVKSVVRKTENDSLKKTLQGFESELSDVPSQKKQNFWKPLSIAASITLLIGISWFVFNSDVFNGTEELYAANYEKYPNTVYTITRGDATDESLERLAFEAYETDDFETAITYLTELKEKTRLDYVDFYLGQAYLANGDYLKATEKFQEIISINSEFKDEGYWYAVLANLKLEQEEEAEKLLEQLIKIGTYKRNEAAELLEKLN